MIIIKVPALNGLGHTKGCEKGPDMILEHLKNIYTNESGHAPAYVIEQIPVNPDDAGETNSIIQKEAEKFFSSEKPMPFLFLGGDHSISYPLMKAFSSSFENAGLIVLDAHADSIHNFTPPTHEDWLRTLIEEGFDPQHVMLMGLRNVHAIESEFLRKSHVHCFDMKGMFMNLQETLDEVTEMSMQFDAVYLSIDIDVAESLHAPGTGYPEPGGLSARELLYVVQRLKAIKNLKAIDIVEVNPEKDINGLTARLAAKIVGEMC